MKSITKSLWAVATLAMAFTSCSKDEVSESPSEARKVIISITTDSELEKTPASRTEYDEAANQMNWSAAGETLEVIELIGTEFTHATTTNYTLNGRAANFEVAFPANQTATNFIYSAVYPAASFADQKAGNTECYRVNLPNEQTPALSSFDPNADLLVAKPVAKTIQPSEGGEPLNFRFQRIASIGKMTLKGITAGEKISKVEFTPSQGKTLAGYSLVNLTTGAVSEIGYYSRGALVLNLGDREATGEDVVWFTTLPATFAEGDSFTIKVSTDKATYEKTVASFTADKPFIFASGGVTKFGITGMTRTENVVDEYILLTDASLLSSGDEIIITSGTSGSVQAIGTTQNSNNRPQTAVTVSGDGKITNISNEVQIFDVEDGLTAGTFALYSMDYTDANDNNLVKSGYIYAVANDNYLRSKELLESDGSWTIEITNKVATIQTIVSNDKVSNEKRIIKYNKTSKLFSCYKSGQENVYIFYKQGAPKIALPTPQNLLADAIGNVVEIVWDAVEGAATYVVKCGTESQTVATTDASFTMDYVKTYDISVTAIPTDKKNYKQSAAATTTVTTGENPNPIIVSVDPSSVEFEAAGGSQNITVTVKNQGANEIVASGLTAPFEATVSGTTVTVSASENTGAAINQTLTLTLVDSKIEIPVKQAAAAGVVITGIVYQENFGTPSSNTAVASFSGWEKGGIIDQSNVTYSYSGGTSTPIRKTSPSSGYTGASGNGCLYTAANGVLTVSNIDITSCKNLSFSLGSQATSSNLEINYKFDTDATATTMTATTSKTGTSWGLVTYDAFTVPAGATSLEITIKIKSAHRIDDLKLTAN